MRRSHSRNFGSGACTNEVGGKSFRIRLAAHSTERPAVVPIVGVLVPLGLSRLGRDPAQGSSVVLTFVTDGMGFFLFLGLARVFLI